MYGHFMMAARRIILLYMAFFVKGKAWLQLMVFMLCSLIALGFILAIRPNESRFINNLNCFNESFTLIVTYLLLELQDGHYSPVEIYSIGEVVKDIFIFWAAINVLLIVIVTIAGFLMKSKRCYFKWCRGKGKAKPEQADA